MAAHWLRHGSPGVLEINVADMSERHAFRAPIAADEARPLEAAPSAGGL